MSKLTPKLVNDVMGNVNILIAYSDDIYIYYSPSKFSYTIVDTSTNERWNADNVNDACIIFNKTVEASGERARKKLN